MTARVKDVLLVFKDVGVGSAVDVVSELTRSVFHRIQITMIENSNYQA